MTEIGRLAAAALLMLAVGAGGAGAQERSPWPSGAGYLAVGVSGIATAELDARLAARGFPTFGRSAAAVALGTHLTLANGVMLGGEWNGLIIGEEAHEGGEVGLGGGYATLGLGYSVEVSPRARIYPRLGIGPGGMGLWIERPGASVGFDEVLPGPGGPAARADSAGTTVLSRDGLVLDLGAGTELLPHRGGRGLLVGLRLGYLAAVSTAPWSLRDRPVSGGPDASIAGPYLRLTVGARPWR